MYQWIRQKLWIPSTYAYYLTRSMLYQVLPAPFLIRSVDGAVMILK